MRITQDQIQTFNWGEIVKIHSINDIDVIEYLPDPENRHRKQFHVFVDGEDTSSSYDTLDEAVIAAIAWKYDGLNSQAAFYFCRMINLNQR